MRTAFIPVILFVTITWAFQRAEAQEVYVLTPDSRLRIEGTSTVDDFTCEAEDIRGKGRLDQEQAAAPGDRTRSGTAVVELIVPVRSFDCGKARMNRDMQNALRADLYPNIEFWLEHVEVTGAGVGGSAYDLRVTGWLNLAGAERNVTIEVRGSVLPGGILRAQGALNLLMTDFGITPPTALLGLVRAHDRITVAFDLYGVREGMVHAAR